MNQTKVAETSVVILKEREMNLVNAEESGYYIVLSEDGK